MQINLEISDNKNGFQVSSAKEVKARVLSAEKKQNIKHIMSFGKS